MKATLLILLLLSPACDLAHSRHLLMQRYTEAETGCPREQIEISNVSEDPPLRWTARGCMQYVDCLIIAGIDRARCYENQAFTRMKIEHLIVERLAMETGCPKEEIAFTQKGSWVRGRETSYLLTACGQEYICLSSPRGTECKRPLAGKEE